MRRRKSGVGNRQSEYRNQNTEVGNRTNLALFSYLKFLLSVFRLPPPDSRLPISDSRLPISVFRLRKYYPADILLSAKLVKPRNIGLNNLIYRSFQFPPIGIQFVIL